MRVKVNGVEKIYFDYNATTPTDPRVVKVMMEFFTENFGNPSSIHSIGRRAREAVENARLEVMKLMHARENDGKLIFTSGATEANNLVLKGLAMKALKEGKNHLIISSIEHSCVMNSAKWLEKQGFKVTYLKVDKYGIVDLEQLENCITKKTFLVSIMHANNEIGTIEPIKEASKICHDNNVLFHTDAAQSFGKIKVDVNELGVDFLTVSAHKMYGPKGIGALWIRGGVSIEPLIHGGGHEYGIRSGTENVPGIVGFGYACKLRMEEMHGEEKRLTSFRDHIIKTVTETIPESYLNGHPVKRLPNNVNIRFSFIEGEALVLLLDEMYGIQVSSGSACASRKPEPSHVLMAIGLKPEEAVGSIRISMGKWTTKEDVEYLLEVLPKAVKHLRDISPFKGKWEV